MSRAAPGRQRRRYLLPALVVGLVAVGLAVFLATRSAPGGATAGSALAGKRAPAISGRSILDGRAVNLSAERGHFVLVDFFASWCSTCINEAPSLAAFAFAHRHDGVALLGVDIEDSAPAGAAFLRRTGADWPAIEDTNGARSIALAYGVAAPPELWLVAPDGRAVGRILGAPTVAQLERFLAEARGRSK